MGAEVVPLWSETQTARSKGCAGFAGEATGRFPGTFADAPRIAERRGESRAVKL